MTRYRHTLGGRTLFSLLLVLAIVAANGFTLSSVMAAEPITIKIRPKATVVGETILLRDVADMTGGDPSDRRRVGEIDLAVINDATSERTFSKSLVAVRVQVAGFARDAFRVIGPKEFTVERIERELSDAQVIQDLERGLALHWELPENSVELQLLEPLETALRRSRVDHLGHDVRVGPLVEPSDIPGRMRLRAGVYRDEKLIHTLLLHVSVSVNRQVAVALNNIHSKQTIGPDDVAYDLKPLTGRAAIQPQLDPIGRVARRYIQSGNTILATDVDASGDGDSSKSAQSTSKEKTDAVVRVKRKTRVQMVARTGRVKVTLANAELVRDSVVGEIVEVKNTSSNTVVQGRLVSPSLVEVSL